MAISRVWIGKDSPRYAITPTIFSTIPDTALADELAIATLILKPSTTTPPSTPDGWNLVADFVGGAGASGVDTGPLRILQYSRVLAPGDAGSRVTFATLVNQSVSALYIVGLESSLPFLTWDLAVATGQDTNPTTDVVAPMTSALDIVPGDGLYAVFGIPTDAPTPSAFVNHVFSATGLTSVSLTELFEADTSLGNDLGGVFSFGNVVSGSTNVAGTYSATATTGTNVIGPASVIRIREIALAAPSIIPPTLAQEYEYALNTAAVASLTNVSYNAGDVILLFIYLENGSEPISPTTPISDLPDVIWCQLQFRNGSGATSAGRLYAGYAKSTQTNQTITVTKLGTLVRLGMRLQVWSNAYNYGTSVGDTTTNTGALTINARQPNCAIAGNTNDFSAIVPGTPTLHQGSELGPAVLTEFQHVTDVISEYSWVYPVVPSSGVKTVGVNSPSTGLDAYILGVVIYGLPNVTEDPSFRINNGAGISLITTSIWNGNAEIASTRELKAS